MIEWLPKEMQEVISSNDNLSRYLFSLTQNVAPTKRSWLYEDVDDPNDILEDWKNRLAALEIGDSFEMEVWKFDTSQEEKWGPQGGHAPMDDLFDEIVKPTFHPSSKDLVFDEDGSSNSYWSDAKLLTQRELRAMKAAGLRMATYQGALRNMSLRGTLESNSGWPDFARRNLPWVKEAAIAAASDGSYRNYPAIALFRTYRGKTRLVWMFPMATNLNEALYYQPLQNAIVNNYSPEHQFYAPWVGFDEVRRLISAAYDNGMYISASDFSSTDAHFQWAATRQVYDVLSEMFTTKEAKDGLFASLRHMHTIPLILGPDRMITGSHGVSSGSNWTNFVESIFDRIFAYYVFSKTGMMGFYAIGDDMSWISKKFNDAFPKQLEQLGKEVGQDIKADKTTNDPDKVKTLQRLFQRGYRRPDGLTRGVYSTIRALNSSVFPERFHDPRKWSSDMFCARQYMILENCVDHPLFEEFVKFVVKGQKDLVPFAKKSSAELKRIHRQTLLLPGLNSTYNQERANQTLADFQSIQYARSL